MTWNENQFDFAQWPEPLVPDLANAFRSMGTALSLSFGNPIRQFQKLLGASRLAADLETQALLKKYDSSR